MSANRMEAIQRTIARDALDAIENDLLDTDDVAAYLDAASPEDLQALVDVNAYLLDQVQGYPETRDLQGDELVVLLNTAMGCMAELMEKRRR